MRQTLRAFFAIAILLTGAAAILALLIATQPAQSLPTLDLYGGRTDIACANSTGHFILEKVGARWWFCTPLGHVYVSMSVTTNAPNSSPTYDCLRTPAGATSGVTWTSGSATYTFASVPAIAIVGSGLVTTGFTPSGYNLTDAKITAVGTDSVTFAMTANPGAATVLGTGAFDGDASTVYVAKYGDAGFNWGWQTLKRAKSWKFNSIGQDSHVDTYATRTCSGCVWPGGVQPLPVPNIIEFKPAQDASINVLSFLSSPIKGEIAASNSNYTAYRGGELYDVFDPGLHTEWVDELARSDQFGADLLRANNQYLLGLFTDDSDFFFGSGAGPDFVQTGGHTNANIAFVTMITSPVQTFITSTPEGGKALFYSDTKNYTKTLATNPVTTCSITNPCSLRDYLWQKYSGSITSLNTAWGSSYTQFDSTGTQVTGEHPTGWTGDGATTSFTATLAHSPLSPFSVQVLVGGTVVLGDCPWFRVGPGQDCVTTTANMGTLTTPTLNFNAQSTSLINYSTGAVTINFVTAPASGAAITVNYVFNGWMSGGTGLVDEDGAAGGTGHNSSTWLGTNVFCLEGANPSYSTYFTCTGAGGNFEPAPNAHAAVGADLDNWLPEMSAQYFKTMHTDLRAVSQIPYFGLDTVGSWGVPAYSKFLQGEAPYVDGAFVQLLQAGNAPAPALFQSAYQYTTQYLGDVPLMDFATLLAESDSAMSCNAATTFENFATQDLRGQEWYNTINYLLNTPGFNGTFPFVGFNWWTWQDFQNSNQGLVSIHDNAYDGVEGVSASVVCDVMYLSSVNCGGEAANYGNLIGGAQGVASANVLWLGLGGATTTFPVKTPKRARLWVGTRAIDRQAARFQVSPREHR